MQNFGDSKLYNLAEQLFITKKNKYEAKINYNYG